jgi:hypothetical protein
MRTLLILSVFCATLPALADEPPQPMSFVDPATRSAPGVTLLPASAAEPHAQLVVEKATPGEQSFEIASVDDPGITLPVYAVTGEVRYENVEGEAYLMTWNCFVDGKYFSKGIHRTGPARSIRGSSDWRRFTLPFRCDTRSKVNSPRPQRVELHLVMSGAGKVAVRNIELKQFAAGENPLAGAGQWWSDTTAGWIGGIGGSLIGCIGGLIGLLAGLGRARQLVLALMVLVTAIGAASLVGGILALAFRQPYAVYYPLLLAGVLCTVLPLAQFRAIRRRYEEVELRRMSAADAACR